MKTPSRKKEPLFCNPPELCKQWGKGDVAQLMSFWMLCRPVWQRSTGSLLKHRNPEPAAVPRNCGDGQNGVHRFPGKLPQDPSHLPMLARWRLDPGIPSVGLRMARLPGATCSTGLNHNGQKNPHCYSNLFLYDRKDAGRSKPFAHCSLIAASLPQSINICFASLPVLSAG